MTTRERLVQSAQELLWERGYVAMSPKAIQDHSGVGQGSMYHHFSGKADLAAVAIRRSASSFREGAEVYLGASGSPLERIRQYMLRSRDALKGCQIGKLTQDHGIVEDPTLRAPINEAFDWLQTRLRELIIEAMQVNELSADVSSEDLAAMLVATIQGAYILASAAASSEPFHKAIRGALLSLR